MFAYTEAARGGAANATPMPNQMDRRRVKVADNHIISGRLCLQVKCRTCGERKLQEDFYAGHIRKDGLVGECKACTKARVRERARNNPAVQEYDRKRAKTQKRRENSRRVTAKWREKNPAGYAAQTAVSNALRDGRLHRAPCLFCGDTNVHAHHRDYAKPLDVIWLCPKCHHRLHANFPETEGVNKEARA